MNRGEHDEVPAQLMRWVWAGGKRLKGLVRRRTAESAPYCSALHFPAAIGCPEFADGVRLYGVVFIDADCPEPIAVYGFEVYGALVVNGNLNTANTKIRLNHIQLADAQQTRLQFPLLRSVAVPGTWKDF